MVKVPGVQSFLEWDWVGIFVNALRRWRPFWVEKIAAPGRTASALFLLVAGIAPAYHAHDPAPTDDLALGTALADRGSNFHDTRSK